MSTTAYVESVFGSVWVGHVLDDPAPLPSSRTRCFSLQSLVSGDTIRIKYLTASHQCVSIPLWPDLHELSFPESRTT